MQLEVDEAFVVVDIDPLKHGSSVQPSEPLPGQRRAGARVRRLSLPHTDELEPGAPRGGQSRTTARALQSALHGHVAAALGLRGAVAV